VLLEASGKAKVAGENRAVFYELSKAPGGLAKGQPASIGGLPTCVVLPGESFDFGNWSSCRARVAVKNGEVTR